MDPMNKSPPKKWRLLLRVLRVVHPKLPGCFQHFSKDQSQGGFQRTTRRSQSFSDGTKKNSSAICLPLPFFFARFLSILFFWGSKNFEAFLPRWTSTCSLKWIAFFFVFWTYGKIVGGPFSGRSSKFFFRNPEDLAFRSTGVPGKNPPFFCRPNFQVGEVWKMIWCMIFPSVLVDVKLIDLRPFKNFGMFFLHFIFAEVSPQL